jgi:hypothetical protein
VPGIDGGAQQSFHGRPMSAEVRRSGRAAAQSIVIPA